MHGHLQHKPQHSQNSACINEETSTSMHDKIEQWHEEANMRINSINHNTSKTAHTSTATVTTWGNSHKHRRQEPYHDSNDNTRAHNDCIHWKDSRPRDFILKTEASRFHFKTRSLSSATLACVTRKKTPWDPKGRGRVSGQKTVGVQVWVVSAVHEYQRASTARTMTLK